MPQTSVFCSTCQQPRLFVAPEMNHILHLLAAVLLCGLWLPIWFGAAILYNPVYRCQTCGLGMTANQIRASRQPASNARPADPVPVKPVETSFWKKPLFGAEKYEPRKVKINRNDVTDNKE